MTVFVFLLLVSCVFAAPVVLFGSTGKGKTFFFFFFFFFKLLFDDSVNQDDLGIGVNVVDLVPASSRVVVVFARAFDAAWQFFSEAGASQSSLERLKTHSVVLPYADCNDGAALAHQIAQRMKTSVLFEEQFSCAKNAAVSAVVFVALERANTQATIERLEACVKQTGAEATFVFVAEVSASAQSRGELLAERDVEGKERMIR